MINDNIDFLLDNINNSIELINNKEFQKAINNIINICGLTENLIKTNFNTNNEVIIEYNNILKNLFSGIENEDYHYIKDCLTYELGEFITFLKI